MNPINVAVTGVGGGVGQSIIKALYNTNYNVTGIDSEILGAGLYATKNSYLGLYAVNQKFIDKIIDICKKENCSAVFPGLDAELIPLSINREKLKSNGILPIISDPKVVEICDNKLKTSEFLKTNSLPYIKTYRLKNYAFELDFPVVLKPQKGGARSVGIFKINNREEFDYHSRNIDVNNYLVQEFIQGEEFTCGTVSLEGKCCGVIVMKRQLRDGDTYKAFVMKNDTISDFVKNVINMLKPFGACNVQLIFKDNTPYIVEINARCSGTTASRALAGFNEPEMICNYIFNGIDKPSFTIKNIIILRYLNELVVSYDKIREMESTGFIHNSKERL